MTRSLLILLGFSFLFVFFSNSCTKAKKSYSDTLAYENKTLALSYNNCITDSPGCAYITYSYPSFSNKHPEADELNKMILSRLGWSAKTSLEQTQQTFIREYAAFVKDNPDAEKAWYAQTNITVPYQNNHVVCLSEEQDDYNGGAHELFSTTYLNYHKKSKKILTMENLFVKDSLPGLYALAEAAFRKATELQATANLEEAGFWFDNKFHLNDNFTLTDDGITWLFNPYEVAAFSEGTLEVSLGKDQILPMLNNNYKSIWD